MTVRVCIILCSVFQGICYVWSLSSGVGTSPITLSPRVKKHAHTRHALKCIFSPDSRYNTVSCIMALPWTHHKRVALFNML